MRQETVTCDRCGYQESSGGRKIDSTFITVAPFLTRFGERDKYDLCIACQAELRSWILAPWQHEP